MVTTSRILGADGQPIRRSDLAEPQTAHMQALHREFQNHPSRGLTPIKLASILQQAEQGNLIAQYELFEDMEEKDAHILSEMSKRRRAVTSLDWSIVPPRNATPRDKDIALALADLLEGLDDLENVLFDATDAIGKGFCCLEIEWHRLDGYWLPKSIQHRPQSWFQLERGFTQEIRLRGAGGGIPLQPMGWIVPIHKAKSGYLERSALFRALAWPYLFKNYSVGDLAEFLEIYGIPLRLGKYPSGATEKEKMTLLRALAQIGHNAAGIIPQGMELEFHNAASGDPDAFALMMDWCDKAQSKAILGGTLTSQADGKTSTNALGSVHNEVRKELLDSDVKQIAKTLSRDLLYPIAALNGLVNHWTRCPRWRFDTNEPEDMTTMASAIPVFLDMGMHIGRQWAQERAGIPEPEPGAELLQRLPAPAPGLVALSARHPPPEATPPALEQLDKRLQPATDAWLAAIRSLVQKADSLEAIRDGLMALAPDMDLASYANAMSEAMLAAQLAGRVDILEEVRGH